MMPSKAILLFSGVGGANAAFDTGDLNTADYDYLLVELIPSGAAAASTLSFYDSGFSVVSAIRGLATPATAAVKSAGWGPGEQPAASGEYVGGCGGALPPLVRVGAAALGVGVTARIRVWARRNYRGDINRPVAPDNTPALD